MKKLLLFVSLLVVMSMVLAACVGAATPEPTEPPAATEAPTETPAGVTRTPTRTPIMRRTATPTQTAIPIPTATIGEETAVQLPFQSQSQQIGDLTLIEYALVSSQVDIDGSNEMVNQVWYTQDAQMMGNTAGPTITEVNAIIEPFGYHVENGALYQGDAVLRERVTDFLSYNNFVANQSKTDFVWAIHNTVYEGWLIHGETIDTYYLFPSNFFIMPQFMGDDLIVVHNYSGSDDLNAWLQVTINDQVVYSQGFFDENNMPMLVTDCPVENLQVWNRHWVLDMENQVIMDGKLLNEELGHDAVFEWFLLDNKPLYFFRDSERYGLVYDGHELPVHYAEVKHQCGSVNMAMMRNVGIEHTDTTANFFAQRDGMWYYVELQTSNP